MSRSLLSLALFIVCCLLAVIMGAGGQLLAQPDTLDRKIAQMLLVGFRGLRVEDCPFIGADIARRNLGGVILFDYDVVLKRHRRNIASPAQLKQLVAELQGLATTPLLVAVDQEGGRIVRLKERYGFPATLSHQQLGAVNDPAVTRQHTLKLAATLHQCGITLNMAPVVDLASNPDNPVIARLERSFSADAQIVTANAAAFIVAHHHYGVLTCLKHFPGHGSSSADSHLGFTDVSASWSEQELVPYRQLLAMNMVDAIMTAHVFNARLDHRYPATLSPATVTGLLRHQLGFDGVVISDDMQMGAITDCYGFARAIRLALEAGVDILVFGNNLHYDEHIVARVIALIHKLVDDGVISPERIDRSYRRIMRLKTNLKQ